MQKKAVVIHFNRALGFDHRIARRCGSSVIR